MGKVSHARRGVGFTLPDKRCKKCKYWRHISETSGGGLKACHYLYRTGETRIKISASECGSFEAMCTPMK